MTEMSIGLLAEPRRAEDQCTLPAVGCWTTYPRAAYRAGMDAAGVKAFPFCRFHGATVRQAADAHATEQADPYYAHEHAYADGQCMVGCAGQANPVQLGRVLDAERILGLQQDARRALQRLTALTTHTFGVRAGYIGNEHAVLEALVELAGDLQEQFEVVKARIGQRGTVHPAEDGSCCATLTGGARVLEQVGWAQHRPVDPEGRVCAREALRIAADGDVEAMVHALQAVDQLLQPLSIDLITWNDRADRRRVDAATLLRTTAQRAAA